MKPLQYYYRKTHRYFGLIIGIQFFFWTLGGIFFAWSDIDQIHGDFNKKQQSNFSSDLNLISPQNMIDLLKAETALLEIQKLELINILGQPNYRLIYFDKTGDRKIALFNAVTGTATKPLSKDEAIQLAIDGFTPESTIKKVELITSEEIHKHHEYRSGPLPAYRIEFDHKSATRVYVSTELAQIITFRNSNWRVFDFLWMMHTMDYKGRDNFGNILLKAFSVLGFITVLSGFALYYISSPTINRKKANR